MHWTEEGMTENSPEHQSYVEQFGEDFKNAVLSKVQADLLSEPLPHPHIVEVSSHASMCVSRSRIPTLKR